MTEKKKKQKKKNVPHTSGQLLQPAQQCLRDPAFELFDLISCPRASSRSLPSTFLKIKEGTT